MLTISREQQHKDIKLCDACRIFLWEQWLLIFSKKTLDENYTLFTSAWKTSPPKMLVDYQKSSVFIRTLFGYSEKDLLENRENYYCGRPTFFSQQIEAKFGYLPASDR